MFICNQERGKYTSHKWLITFFFFGGGGGSLGNVLIHTLLRVAKLLVCLILFSDQISTQMNEISSGTNFWCTCTLILWSLDKYMY